jgi:hypothetical protein
LTKENAVKDDNNSANACEELDLAELAKVTGGRSFVIMPAIQPIQRFPKPPLTIKLPPRIPAARLCGGSGCLALIELG